MKVQVYFKTPDAVYYALEDVAEEDRPAAPLQRHWRQNWPAAGTHWTVEREINERIQL